MISIVTSLYKSKEYLPVFIKRVKRVGRFLEKSNIPFELIVIANEPTEQELRCLKGFSDSCDWVRVENVQRESIYTSWNRGIGLSLGSSVCFWNVDDIRFAKALIKGDKLIKSGETVVYFPFIYFRYLKLFGIRVLVKVTRVQPSKFSLDSFSREMHIGPFFMFSKSFFREVGDFDQSFKIAGDFDWQKRAAKKGRFYLLNCIAGVFTSDGSGLSTSRNSLHEEENKRIKSQ